MHAMLVYGKMDWCVLSWVYGKMDLCVILVYGKMGWCVLSWVYGKISLCVILVYGNMGQYMYVLSWFMEWWVDMYYLGQRKDGVMCIILVYG